MSIQLLQKLDEADFSNLTPNEKLVLLALVTSAEKGGNFSWAGINLIRKRTSINLPTTIRKAIRGLIDKGYLKRDKQEGKGKLRDGFIIIIPTKKMKTYHEFLEVEKEQTALREESKMLHYGGSKLLSINSKDRNSKNRNSKKLLASPKEKNWSFPMTKEDTEGGNILPTEKKEKSSAKKEKKKFNKPNKNVGMSVDNIVNQHIEKEKIPKKVSASYLFGVWEKSCKKKNPKYIKIRPSGKIRGCLRNILKGVGQEDSVNFIQVIISDWYGFQQVAQDQDAKSTCLHPSIPYLTQYIESAMLFYGKKKLISPQNPEPTGVNLASSTKQIASPSSKAKKGVQEVSGKNYLTQKEQDEKLDEEMKQFHKDKEEHFKGKKH